MTGTPVALWSGKATRALREERRSTPELGGRAVPRSRSQKKPQRNRRTSSPRDARVMQEIKNQRYLSFVRAIVGAHEPGSRR
jgi:hypothetical protein